MQDVLDQFGYAHSAPVEHTYFNGEQCTRIDSAFYNPNELAPINVIAERL